MRLDETRDEADDAVEDDHGTPTSGGADDDTGGGAGGVSPPDRPSRGLEILSAEDFEGDEDEDDPDADPDEDDDLDDEDSVRVVLITGASGNIGRKLRAAWADAYDLVLIDNHADPDDRAVFVADLSVLDEGWLTHFHGVDTVVHLAANPDDSASWEDLEKPNLDALANVYHASALAGVERLIFASSNHAMGGYREFEDMPITVDLPPKPDGPYGATKLMGERLGRSLSHAFDITFIALRLGWNQAGENLAETLPDDWSRGLWLSNADLVRLFDSAVEAELDDRLFVVLNGMSNNRGTRWDLSATAELLEYYPEDDAYAEEI